MNMSQKTRGHARESEPLRAPGPRRSLRALMQRGSSTRAAAGGSGRHDDFGQGMGKEYGFKMNVDLCIQVEAIAQP